MHRRDLPITAGLRGCEGNVHREREVLVVFFTFDLARRHQPAHPSGELPEFKLIREVLLTLVETLEKMLISIFNLLRPRPDFSWTRPDNDGLGSQRGENALHIVAGHGIVVRLEQSPDFLQFRIFGFCILGLGRGSEAGNGSDRCEPGDD